MRQCAMVVLVAGLASAASGQVVYDSLWNNGFFTPFNANTPSNVRYGDSGWIGTGASAPVALDSITLSMVVFNGGLSAVPAGSTRINFTFNDGDPSGLIFGGGGTLMSVSFSVALPELEPDQFSVVPVSIPLGGIQTLGGFNNVGFSVGVENFAYGASLGFAATNANGMLAGFYTNNASFFNGTNWSLFAFGADPVTGIAQYVARIYAVPAPGAMGVLVLGGLAATRRRR